MLRLFLRHAVGAQLERVVRRQLAHCRKRML